MSTRYTDVLTERFAPEGGRWYGPDAKVVSMVPSAKGDKLIKPKITHAAKFNLVPSVTHVLSQVRKEGFERWEKHQLLLAALTLPRGEGEPLEAFAVRVTEDWETQGKKARDAGAELHAAIDRYYADRILPDTEVGCTAVHWIDEWLRGMNATEIEGEYGFVVPGQYGGTIDCRFLIDGRRNYVDWKTVEDKVLDDYEPYEHHGWQLAGYGAGTGGTPADRYWNVAIGRQSSRCVPYEWAFKRSKAKDMPGMVENFDAWGHIFNLWQIRKGWPMTGVYDE